MLCGNVTWADCCTGGIPGCDGQPDGYPFHFKSVAIPIIFADEPPTADESGRDASPIFNNPLGCPKPKLLTSKTFIQTVSKLQGGLVSKFTGSLDSKRVTWFGHSHIGGIPLQLRVDADSAANDWVGLGGEHLRVSKGLGTLAC